MNADISYHDLYSEFFSDIRLIKNQDEFIKRTLICAEFEENKTEKNLMLTDAERNKIKSNIQGLVKKKINKYIDGKLKTLTQYKALLPEQISRKLTNCTISYDEPGVTLIAHDDILTGDYDEYSRKINTIYLNDIFSENSQFKKTFSSVLEKAFIKKVSYNSNLHELLSSSELDCELYNKISFSYFEDSAEILLINKEYERLLELLISKVKYYLNERNYILATINMFNFDDVYSMLKRNLRSNGKAIDVGCKEIIENYSPFDFKSKIIDFPRGMQSELQNLVGILEFNEIYKAYYKFDVESKKNLRFSQIRKNGGMAFSSDEFKLRAKLYPYIYFILVNEILIEEYTEVKTLFEFNILASIEHYLSEDNLHINIMDLFILIKYCETQKIKDLLVNLTNNKKITSNSSLDKKIFITSRSIYLTLSKICAI